MKTYRGPLNIKCITRRNPNTLMGELRAILTQLEITYKEDKPFSLKCQYQTQKFGVEINLLENLEKVFIFT